MDRLPLQDINIDAALRTILEGTATETGEQFFKALPIARYETHHVKLAHEGVR